MFNKGKIQRYNAEQGFGFITMNAGGQDVFFHIRDLPNREIEPAIGENLKFMIVEENGKFKADNIMRLDLMCELSQAENSELPLVGQTQVDHLKSSQRKLGISMLAGLIGLLVLAVLGSQLYQYYQERQQLKVQQLVEEQKKIIAAQRAALGDSVSDEIIVKEKREEAAALSAAATVKPASVSPVVVASQTQFSCDGRTHCSQMRSYEEAVFFLKNCPGNQMDGDNDGQPCENDSRW